MKRSCLSAYMGLLIVGMTATAALLLETRLPVSQDVHFLLQLLWLGVAMGSLFVMMLQPTTKLYSHQEFRSDFHFDEVPEWRDPDRVWMQQHPNELYLADDIDKEEA